MNKSKREQMLNIKGIEAYMRKKGIPNTMIEQLRLAYADRAVRDARTLKLNRMYTLIALSLRENAGWGKKRITRAIFWIDKIAGEINESDDPNIWTKTMKECRDRTGLIIRTGEEGDEYYEYADDTER